MALLLGVWGWWAFDIFTLIGSYLSVSVISAQTIMRSLGLLTYMVPLGIATACGILIGQNIGKGDENAIRHYFKVSMGFSVVMGLVLVVVLLGFKGDIITIFTKEPNVEEEMSKAW